jgi:IS30 family transposase
MRGQPLTFFERQRIEIFLRGKWKVRQIARNLFRDHSVIVRELARNTDKDGVYRAVSAQAKAEKRNRRPYRKKLEVDEDLRNHVVKKLMLGWSPQIISGRLKNRPDSEMAGSYVCHETIYSFIYEGEGRFMGLYQYLVRKNKKRVRRFSRKPRKNKGLLHTTPIKYRPKEINERQEFGHWESDSIVSKKSKPALLVQVERSSRLIRITKVDNTGAEETEEAIKLQIKTLSPTYFKSITFDNGSEGANHWKLMVEHNLDTYHCDPYCSWQKGTVENSNGLIRRYFPKGTDFSLITRQQIYDVQERLNNRPRKVLGYKTSSEAWTELTGQMVH